MFSILSLKEWPVASGASRRGGLPEELPRGRKMSRCLKIAHMGLVRRKQRPGTSTQASALKGHGFTGCGKRNPEGAGGFNPRIKPIESIGPLGPEGINPAENDYVTTIMLSPQGLNRLRKKGK
jgi:hypothetical protein